MPAVHGRGTIIPAKNFNADKAAAKLQKSMKCTGLAGTDEWTIVVVLVSHSNSQRQEIKIKYKSLYGRDLVTDIQSKLGGNLEDFCVALLMPPIEYLADCLQDAMPGRFYSGLGTDEKCLIEILCSYDNRDIEGIKTCYKRKYQKNLEECIINDTRDHFRNLLQALILAQRDEDVDIDIGKAEKDAQKLYDRGINTFGTDDELFTKIFCSRSRAQLQATCDAYERIAGQSLTAAIRSEFSSDSKDTLLSIVYCIKSKSHYFAKQLKECLKGLDTDINVLIRILVTRSEIDLQDIKEAYQDLYWKELTEDIYENSGEDYRKALIRLLQP